MPHRRQANKATPPHRPGSRFNVPLRSRSSAMAFWAPRWIVLASSGTLARSSSPYSKRQIASQSLLTINLRNAEGK
jgi:hypothetical protein